MFLSGCNLSFVHARVLRALHALVRLYSLTEHARIQLALHVLFRLYSLTAHARVQLALHVLVRLYSFTAHACVPRDLLLHAPGRLYSLLLCMRVSR